MTISASRDSISASTSAGGCASFLAGHPSSRSLPWSMHAASFGRVGATSGLHWISRFSTITTAFVHARPVSSRTAHTHHLPTRRLTVPCVHPEVNAGELGRHLGGDACFLQRTLALRTGFVEGQAAIFDARFLAWFATQPLVMRVAKLQARPPPLHASPHTSPHASPPSPSIVALALSRCSVEAILILSPCF